MKLLLLILISFIVLPGFAQDNHVHIEDRVIDFPDVPGMYTLKTDLHIHTVFSDGSVWPTIRIQEAQRDGLDVVSMTEHLEYQPHEDDIPHPDRNRSHNIAIEQAEGSELIVVRGSEITRKMPPGHSNAIFIEDANKLILDDPEAVFAEANNQGAFIFWNHPNWTAQAKDGMAKLTKMHKRLIEKGQLNGIEVVNEHTYSKEALQIALDNNLTIMGTSDVHGLVDWDFNVPEGGHRPITLVFAKERSAAGVKEALFAGNTAVWFNNTLIGKAEMLQPLLKASLTIKTVEYGGDTKVLNVVIENNSDADYMLYNKTDYSFHANDNLIVAEAHSQTTIQVKTGNRKNKIELSFEVMNAVIAPDTYAHITWQLPVSK